MAPQPFIPDGETRTSRIVGSADFNFPVVPPTLDDMDIQVSEVK